MITVLAKTDIQENRHTWSTTDGVFGITYQVTPVDYETVDFESFTESLSRALGRLTPEVLVSVGLQKIEIKGEDSLYEPKFQRARALSNLGYLDHGLTLSIQTKDTPFFRGLPFLKRKAKSALETVLEAERVFTDEGLKLQSLEPWGLGPDSSQFKVLSSSLDLGSDIKGVVRLEKPSAFSLDQRTLSLLVKRLPVETHFSVRFQKVGEARAQLLLQSKIKQGASGKTRLSLIKADAAENALGEVTMSGDALFEMEILITVSRKSEVLLRETLGQCARIFNALGETRVETFGVLPSFAATLPGSPMHVPFLERAKNLPFYLPLLMEGGSDRNFSASSFVFHRENESLGGVDLLGTRHMNANLVIVGASGRGKSGVVGTLTKSLLNDPNVSVIKVDVGGSHSRECDLLGGAEYKLNMRVSSGINPFSVFENGHEASEEERAILGNFIAVLIMADGESALPKALKVEIDAFLKAYSESAPLAPSLDGFYEFAVSFPRRDLLSRWVSGGIFGRAFSTQDAGARSAGSWTDSREGGPAGESVQFRGSAPPHPLRLRYYNFSEIFQASDPDFAQAGMAAVLAQFNIEMRMNPDRRLILICDETPFFIQKCFEFFKFSTANVRKFGAGVVLVVQVSKNLVVGDDTSVIENSYHRILMSSDGKKEEFQERFSLTDEQMKRIDDLKSKPKEFSEFLYSNQIETLKGRLRLTPEEYWEITTTQSEKQKIESLMTHVPSLTLKEALTCLALNG